MLRRAIVELVFVRYGLFREAEARKERHGLDKTWIHMVVATQPKESEGNRQNLVLIPELSFRELFSFHCCVVLIDARHGKCRGIVPQWVHHSQTPMLLN